MPAPRFGVLYSRYFPILRPGDFAAHAEAYRLDSVWASDGPGSPIPSLDPVVTMGSMVHSTERIRIGSCVILVPLRNPGILAKEIASLDAISGGRIDFGIGVGGASAFSSPEAFRAVGIDPRERGARCDESLEVMTKLWSGESISHRGRFFRIEDIAMAPAPIQRPHPPIWMGGTAEGMLRRTARVGQGFVPVAPGSEEYAALWSRIEHHAEAAGRDPSQITRGVHLYYCTGDSRAAAHAKAERSLSARYAREMKLADDGRFALGDVAACVGTLMAYREVGVDYFVFNWAGPTEAVSDEVERLARDVMPQLA